MKWILLICLCLAVAIASAKYGKINRYNRNKQIDRSPNDFDSDQSDDDWTGIDDSTFEETDDDDSDDDPWRQPNHKRNQQRQPGRDQRSKRPNWVPQNEVSDDFENQNQQDYPMRKQSKYRNRNEDDDFDSDDFENQNQQRNPSKRQPRRHHRNEDDQDDDDQPEKPCQPNYQLLQNMDQINLHLAARLYQEAKKLNDDQNTIVSPIATQLGLAAVSQGARGRTRGQINQLLDFGMKNQRNQDAYMALVKILKGQGPSRDQDYPRKKQPKRHHPNEDNQDDDDRPDKPRPSGSKNIQIKTTTNIILSQQSAQEHFIESLKTCFDGEVKRCDFHAQPQECLKQINQFISTKTNQKLQHPLSRNSITQNTRMVSVNTMQVKANWPKHVQNKKQKVGQGQFYPLGEKQPVPVKILQIEDELNYFEDEQLRILGIQTQEKQLTTYVIIPKRKNGLNKLEKQRIQYGKQLEKLIDDCDSNRQFLKIQIPLFQIVYELDSKDVLQKLGVQDAFDFDEADFSGIHDEQAQEEHLLKHGRRETGGLEDVDSKSHKRQNQKTYSLHLNKFIQQATIQINENGIDSANSQNQQYQGKQQPKDNKKNQDDDDESDHDILKIDRAFAFLIKHNPSNQLLLVGRVIDPTQDIKPDQNQYHEEV